MELFLEFVFTVSLSLVLFFIIAKLLSLSSINDQHLVAVPTSCMEGITKSKKYVAECEKGFGFVSELVKVDALGGSVDKKDELEESLNVNCGSTKVKTEETIEETSYGEEKFVNETTEIEEIEALEYEKENGGDCLKEGLSDGEEDYWEGIERTELQKDFGAAVCFMECTNNGDQNLKLDNDVKTQLYGFRKIAIEGPCHEPQTMALKLSTRAKWNAWKRHWNMSSESAMEKYITLLSRSIPALIQDDNCGPLSHLAVWFTSRIWRCHRCSLLVLMLEGDNN